MPGRCSCRGSAVSVKTTLLGCAVARGGGTCCTCIKGGALLCCWVRVCRGVGGARTSIWLSLKANRVFPVFLVTLASRTPLRVGQQGASLSVLWMKGVQRNRAARAALTAREGSRGLCGKDGPAARGSAAASRPVANDLV